MLKYSLYRFFWCLAPSTLSSGRFGPAVATEASSQVFQRRSPKDLRIALFLFSYSIIVWKADAFKFVHDVLNHEEVPLTLNAPLIPPDKYSSIQA